MDAYRMGYSWGCWFSILMKKEITCIGIRAMLWRWRRGGGERESGGEKVWNVLAAQLAGYEAARRQNVCDHSVAIEAINYFDSFELWYWLSVQGNTQGWRCNWRLQDESERRWLWWTFGECRNFAVLTKTNEQDRFCFRGVAVGC